VKRKLIAIAIAAVMMMQAGCSDGGSDSSGSNSSSSEKVFLTLAASPSSAAIYPYWVAIAKGIQETYPEFSITVSETQGSLDGTKRIRSGESDLGNGIANTDLENYKGTGAFEGEPFPDARLFWYYDATQYNIVVSKESGITDLDGLTGEKFSSGGTGMTVSLITEDILDYLGVKPDYFDSGKTDAGEAVGNRQIVGIAATGVVPDSFVMQINAALPVNIIDLPDDVRDKIIEQFPYMIKSEIPANTYEGIDYVVHNLSFYQGCQTTANLSQENGYKIVKAMNENGRQYWESTSASAAKQDVLEITLNSTIPLHAGTVQYMVEQGIDVPEHLIPPEYEFDSL